MFVSTMFVKTSAARFSERCGCTVAHTDDGARVRAWFDPCDKHYELGIDGQHVEVSGDARVAATISCGCLLSHSSGRGSAWTACVEHEAAWRNSMTAQGFQARGKPVHEANQELASS